jgi:hypothetical protein
MHWRSALNVVFAHYVLHEAACRHHSSTLATHQAGILGTPARLLGSDTLSETCSGFTMASAESIESRLNNLQLGSNLNAQHSSAARSTHRAPARPTTCKSYSTCTGFQPVHPCLRADYSLSADGLRWCVARSRLHAVSKQIDARSHTSNCESLPLVW